jgi:hypothetical protein
MTLGPIAAALALAACGTNARPEPAGPAPPAPSATGAAPSPTTPATPDGYPTVVGTLNVMIARTTPESVIPDEPVSYSLAVKPRAGSASTTYRVGPDDTFALALSPGTYEVALLEVQAANLGLEPMAIPIAADKRLVLEVPETGCRYGGEVLVVYGRLPAGTERQQQDLVERAGRDNNKNYGFVFRPDGGFVLAGASVSLPASPQRPPAAAGCVTKRFRLVTSA